ncbi:UNVERIFIED_CONTAM: hypothetical protein PYX00_007458 [Menopon gallinae]|uniref:Uncharacterized protein n=1 Tax=Menopon gallinae TaxID=328185 RepID=A0AAW2HJ84_9NEOP
MWEKGVGGDLEKVCRKADAVGLKFSKIRCEYMRIVQQMQRQLYQLGLNPEEAEADISTLMRLKRFTFGKACSAETSKCPLVNPEPSFDCPKQLRPQPSNECQRQSKTQQSSGRYFW